ncbi:MAG TPA: N-acetyl sugar amidotransferase [Desulfovibrio sp.]|uniref:N-acetyl sugar amidotransferase n=1 Tax=Desulfovibrio sp. TaxID=885 RepID=UPI002C9781AC|nr:N-acetyl sugar amidotransferase [Desulfovibrio sp.]HMM39181.1 N-acetyl sugar amidotransferase [Desulfovibrio sp.]
MKKLFTTQPSGFPVIDNQLPNLPREVKFCTNCVTSNQRPRMPFDEYGVCSACRYAEIKETIDWKERDRELRDLLGRHRSKDGRYDCIVPSSGGKDSAYVAHTLKTVYGMHPLTVTWAPFMYTDIGRRNYENFVHAGFDNLFCMPDGIKHRKLSRIALECNGDAWDPFAWGQKAFAMQIALHHNIPLVFYGENGELEYGGSLHALNKACEDVRDWKELYFRGNGVDELAAVGEACGVFAKDELQPGQLDIYKAPPLEKINELGLQMHWFSYYKKWIPQENYYCAVEHTGFETNPERSEGTYTKYASLDDRTDGFHFWFGYLKFGMGRTTRDASMEVRSKHITRDEAVALVHKYDGEFPRKYFQDFLDYLDMDEAHFWEVADKFRTKHLWEKIDDEWRLKHRVDYLK